MTSSGEPESGDTGASGADPVRRTAPAFTMIEAPSRGAWWTKVVGLGLGVVALVVVAAFTLVALVGDGGGDADRIATESVPANDQAPTAASTLGSDEPTSTTPRDGTSERTVIVVNDDGDDEITTEIVQDGETAATTPAAIDEASDEVVDERDGGRNLLGGDDPENKRMPDVVCMGLQRAQDEIQDRGVFGSKSEDATGEGRRQIWDRNWIVVGQEPAAGEPIGEFDAVLSVVKTDEDHDC